MDKQTWILHIEPTPGTPTAEDGVSAGSLKDRARAIWRADKASVKCVFTITDPIGSPWAVCTRYKGGAWRFEWEDPATDTPEARAERDRWEAQGWVEDAVRLEAEARELRERARLLNPESEQ